MINLQLPGFTSTFAWGIMVLTIVVHISFAVGILIAASQSKQKGRETWGVHAVVWALAALLGGVLVAAAYWLIHHSALSQPEEGADKGGSAETGSGGQAS